jgi:hypothetical protein
MDFNAASAHGTVNNSTHLFDFGTDSFEIEVSFFNLPKVVGDSTLVSKYCTGGSRRGVQLVMKSAAEGGGMRLWLGAGDGSSWKISEVEGAFVPEGWRNVRFVKTATSVSWYVDGSPVVSSGTAPVSIPFFSTVPWEFGRRFPDANYFNGGLAYVRIKNITTGEESEWHASRAYGTTLPDSTGTNDATLVSTTFDFVPITGQVVFFDDHAAWSNAARYFRKHQNGYIAFCKNAFLAAQQLPSASFFVQTLNAAADNLRLEMRELDSREGGTETGSFRAVVSALPTGPVNVYTTSGTAAELILDVSDVYDPGDSVWIQLSKELPDGTRIDRSGLINIVLT